MKILQINTVCGIGSTGRICSDIAELLFKKGQECKIAYGRNEVPEKCEKFAVKIGSDIGVKLHAFGSRIFDNTGFYSYASTKKFLKWAEEYDPDIIHLHNIHGYYINIKLLFEYLKKSGKPVVWTLHDCWAFTGHCPYFDLAGCDKWKKQCYKCKLKGEYPKSLFFDNSKRNYSKKRELFTSLDNLTLITPSKWLAGLAEQSFLGKYPIKVINNGIDLEVFKPTYGDFLNRFNIQDKKIVLGVANGWTSRKGLADFLKLRKILSDEYCIVLVGLSDKQIASLPDGVVGIKRTDSVSELAQLYTAADVFLNPTYEDNFPTVNIEALACGTPVITYDTGGSPEIINKNCGAVVPKGDINAIKKSIYDIDFKISECINRAYDFNKNDRFLEYISFYQSLLI